MLGSGFVNKKKKEKKIANLKAQLLQLDITKCSRTLTQDQLTDHTSVSHCIGKDCFDSIKQYLMSLVLLIFTNKEIRNYKILVRIPTVLSERYLKLLFSLQRTENINGKPVETANHRLMTSKSKIIQGFPGCQQNTRSTTINHVCVHCTQSNLNL